MVEPSLLTSSATSIAWHLETGNSRYPSAPRLDSIPHFRLRGSMFPRPSMAVLCLVLGLTACRRAENQPPPAADDAPTAPAASKTTPTTPATPAGPAVAEADVSAVLEEMTQALRKFSFEKKRLPGSIDELVTAGYLGAKPTAPGGKRFTIDPKEARVVLK